MLISCAGLDAGELMDMASEDAASESMADGAPPSSIDMRTRVLDSSLERPGRDSSVEETYDGMVEQLDLAIGDAMPPADMEVSDSSAPPPPVDSGPLDLDLGPMEDPDANPVDIPDMNDVDPAEAESTGYNLCANASVDRAPGHYDAPIISPFFPFRDQHTTRDGDRRFQRYNCAPDTPENGPERIYQFTLETPADFFARVRDGNGVDVDLHLLRHLDQDNGMATGCLARAHEDLVVDDLQAGTYWLVIDSWTNGDGVDLDGAFSLEFDISIRNAWRRSQISNDVEWSRYDGLIDGESQSVNVVRVSGDRKAEMVIQHHRGCQRVSDAAGDALIGINGGYFGVNCSVVGDLVVGGQVISRSAPTTPPLEMRPWVSWRRDALEFAWYPNDSQPNDIEFGLSSHPMLAQNGLAQAAVQPEEQVYSAIDWARNPRSVMAQADDGDVLLITIDGRSAGRAGLSTPALADWLVETLDVRDAVNLDGGGSTTLYIRGCSADGVVNTPSDNQGERAVATGVFVP